MALHRTVARLGIHREVEKVVGVGVALLVGLALTGLAQALVVKVAQARRAMPARSWRWRSPSSCWAS